MKINQGQLYPILGKLDENGLIITSEYLTIPSNQEYFTLTNYSNKSGIYMFKDLSSNNRYIGSAICLRSRRYSHKQEAKNDH